jgi:uncharacterized DUF497 family protein
MEGFSWDDDNIKHIAGHNITVDDAEQVVSSDPIDLTFQFAEGEERVVQIGETNCGRILVVVTTWRGALIRVVTAFPAVKALRKLYVAQRGTVHAGGIEEAELQE